jgi:ABC-2 type transport system permease protein
VKHHIGATLRRLRAIGRIETLFICGDRATLGLVLVVPAMQIALFGYAVRFDPRDVPIAISRALADPGSALSAAIDDTGYLRVVADGLAPGAAEQRVRSRQALIGVELGEGTAAAGGGWNAAGEPPRLIVDASEPSAVRPAVLALESAWLRRTLLGVEGDPEPVVRVAWLYNPEGTTAWSLVPGLAGVVVMISALLLGALTLVREREQGTWEALLATPVRPVEALLGKLSPYVLLGVLQAGGVVGLGHVLFGVPVHGPLAWLLAASAVLAAAHLALGFALSALAKTQVQAVQAAVLFYLPSMVLSGFMFPFEGMPRWAQALGEALPLTHFVRAARGVLLRGAGGAEVAAELWPIVLFLASASALALVAYRRRLD